MPFVPGTTTFISWTHIGLAVLAVFIVWKAGLFGSVSADPAAPLIQRDSDDIQNSLSGQPIISNNPITSQGVEYPRSYQVPEQIIPQQTGLRGVGVRGDIDVSEGFSTGPDVGDREPDPAIRPPTYADGFANNDIELNTLRNATWDVRGDVEIPLQDVSQKELVSTIGPLGAPRKGVRMIVDDQIPSDMDLSFNAFQ